ncbi:Uu.00g013360.m01.CDS01 [Anthostomella pinea]|uniref:Uu.00g013360.m01.CDS01 n=1 Tax=Anthostomella pinea TaxID=933095 RepID=A0AAI8YMZ7_9PEZI|nr:Uu.00g013360.m01.CDS01 [Anthostomella pinea]
MKLTPYAAYIGLALRLPQLTTAVPNITVEALGTSCTAYPGYGAGAAGPFLTVADSTGQAVDGVGLDAHLFFDNHLGWGFVTAPAAVVMPASAPSTNISFHCANSTLQAQVNMTTEGGGEPVWQDLVISGDPNLLGGLGFAFPEGRCASIPVEPYWHFVDGEQQPGVFLGAKGSTT